MGRDLSDKEIQNNVDPLVKDYFLCSTCEDKLQRLESLVSVEIYQGIQYIPNKQKIGANVKELSIEKVNYLKALFISIVWRVSVTGNFGSFKLHPELEERIRALLDSTLSLDSGILRKNLSSLNFSDMPILIACQASVHDGNNKTDNNINFDSGSPYYAIINEFIMCLYESSELIKDSPQKYFGFEELFNEKMFEEKFNEENILIIEEEEWKKINDGQKKFVLEEKLKYFQELFSLMYEETCKRKPLEEEVRRFTEMLIKKEFSLANYSEKHFTETLMLFFAQMRK